MWTRDFLTALQMLNRVVDKGEAQDPTLLSAVGRLYLQIGHSAAAESVFKLVEARFSAPENEITVLLNRFVLLVWLTLMISSLILFPEAL